MSAVLRLERNVGWNDCLVLGDPEVGVLAVIEARPAVIDYMEFGRPPFLATAPFLSALAFAVEILPGSIGPVIFRCLFIAIILTAYRP